MKLYLEASYGSKQLEIVSKFAWENKLNLTIDYPKMGDYGFVVADESESCHKDYTFIDIKGFNSYDELCECIATEIIGG